MVERRGEFVAGTAEEIEPRLPLGGAGGGGSFCGEQVLALVFGALSLTDVSQEGLRIERLAARIARGRRLLTHPDDAAVARDQAVFGSHGRSVIRVLELFHHDRAVLGMQQLREEVGLIGPLGRGVARQLVDQRADVERGAAVAGLREPSHQRQAVDERAEARFRQVELLLLAAITTAGAGCEKHDDDRRRRPDRRSHRDPRRSVGKQDQRNGARGQKNEADGGGKPCSGTDPFHRQHGDGTQSVAPARAAHNPSVQRDTLGSWRSAGPRARATSRAWSASSTRSTPTTRSQPSNSSRGASRRANDPTSWQTTTAPSSESPAPSSSHAGRIHGYISGYPPLSGGGVSARPCSPRLPPGPDRRVTAGSRPGFARTPRRALPSRADSATRRPAAHAGSRST